MNCIMTSEKKIYLHSYAMAHMTKTVASRFSEPYTVNDKDPNQIA